MAEEKKVVLVVDDTPTNIQLVSGILRGEYKVKAATSGERALAIATASPSPDAIVLDVMMPGMDGYEVCRRLRDDPATARIPVIFLSGNTDDAEREKGLALGAVDYVSKPVDPGALQALVRSCVGDG